MSTSASLEISKYHTQPLAKELVKLLPPTPSPPLAPFFRQQFLQIDIGPHPRLQVHIPRPHDLCLEPEFVDYETDQDNWAPKIDRKEVLDTFRSRHQSIAHWGKASPELCNQQ